MLRISTAPKKKRVAWTGSVQKHNILISPNKIKCRAVSDADNDWRFKSNNCCSFAHPPNAASINNVNVTRRAVPSRKRSRSVWTERFLSLHLWLPVSHLYLWIHKSSERVWHSAKKSLLNCLNFLLPKRFNLRHWSDFLGRSSALLFSPICSNRRVMLDRFYWLCSMVSTRDESRTAIRLSMGSEEVVKYWKHESC